MCIADDIIWLNIHLFKTIKLNTKIIFNLHESIRPLLRRIKQLWIELDDNLLLTNMSYIEIHRRASYRIPVPLRMRNGLCC